MSSHIEAQLAAVEQRVLLGVVRSALDDDRAHLIDWHVRPVGYVKLNPASEGLYRVSGSATTRNGEYRWSLILKVMRLPEEGLSESGVPLPAGWGAVLTHPEYWKREALAYGSGLLSDLPGELVAPRCYGVMESGNDGMPPANTVWLWLEDVVGMPGTDWPLARYELAARHLGQLNGAYLAGNRPLPTAPWLNTTWRRAWAEEAGLHRLDWDRLRDPTTWAHPRVRRAFADPEGASTRLSRLRTASPTLLHALERLPPTLCHIDAFSRNLISRPTLSGQEQTVAVDWALMGIGVGGDDVGQLVTGSLFYGDVAPGAAAELWTLVLAGYVAGLRDSGWHGDEQSIRFAAAASMVIRLGFSIPAMIFDVIFAPRRIADLEQRWRAPLDQLVTRWGAVATFLLDRADEVIPSAW